MLKLSEYIRTVPAFWPALAFTGGILLKDFFNNDIPVTVVMLILFLIMIIIIPISFLKSVPFGKISNLLLPAGFLFAGYGYSTMNHKTIPTTEKEYLLAEAVSLPSPKKASTHIKLRMLKLENNRLILKNRSFINAYFAEEQSLKLPEPGEIIIVKSRLSKISNAGNPHEFNYKRYLSLKNIYFSTYIKDKEWEILSFQSFMSDVKLLSLQFKLFLQQKIKNIARTNDALHPELMLAICTGDKSELEYEIKTSFSNAGAIHVMAVSGLHVGMIWMFLQYLTFFLKKSKPGKILQFILIIAILWFYALMTGLSASVVRSVTMFTIASLGGLMNRKAIIFNTLFIAAFIQVIINPKIIYDVGFQFSYTAVLSILLFHPPLNKILRSKNIFFKHVLNLVNVSISAQILTFSLAAYYFHQFPVYFLLTNLLVIPLVTLLMMLFLTSVLFLFIPPVADFFLNSSLRITGLMEDSVELVNSMPGNTIQNIDLNLSQVYIILLIPLLFLLFHYYRKFLFLFLGSTFFLLSLGIAVMKYNYRDKSSICVFNLRDGTAINLLHHDRNLLVHNDSIDMQGLKYATSAFFSKKLAGNPDYITFDEVGSNSGDYFFSLPGNNNFIYTTGSSLIALINDNSIFSDYTSGTKIKVDIMVLGNTPLPSLNDIQRHFHISSLVLGSSIPSYIPDMKLSDSLSVIYHKVSRDGAYVDEL